MEPLPGCNIKYLNISRNDEAWGLVVTTAGYQAVAAHSSYPQAQHPESHIFDPGKGRVLKEYQLVYISRGEGYFESRSCRRQRIRAGTMILLFPGEWHTYEPDRATGWFEHWVGFRGGSVDAQVANGFFSPRSPVFDLGFSQTIIGMYEEIVGFAENYVMTAVNNISSSEYSGLEQAKKLFLALTDIKAKEPGLVFLFCGDSLTSEDPRLQAELNRFYGQLQAVFKQSLRLAVAQEEVPENYDVLTRANMLVALILGHWLRFAKRDASGGAVDPEKQVYLVLGR